MEGQLDCSNQKDCKLWRWVRHCTKTGRSPRLSILSFTHKCHMQEGWLLPARSDHTSTEALGSTTHWSAPCPDLQAGQGLLTGTAVAREASVHFNQTLENKQAGQDGVLVAQNKATLWAVIQRSGRMSGPYLFPSYCYILREKACNFHSDTSIPPLGGSQQGISWRGAESSLYSTLLVC